MSQDEKILRTTSPWCLESELGTLDLADEEFIKSLGVQKTYPAGSYLFVSGDYIEDFIYIDKGTVQYTISNKDGLEKIVYYTNKFVAAESYFHKQPVYMNGAAVDDVTVYIVPANKVEILLERTNIRNLLIRALSVRCRILGWQVADLSLRNPMQKICRILCCYYFTNDGEALKPISHQMIADLTGLHRVTVTNYLQTLRKMDIIGKTEDQNLVVKNRQALQNLAFSENQC